MTIRRGKKRANLRDVAKAAGVSVATVSRVLNTPAKVRTDTRELVEAKIVELSFVRSAAARAINTGRSKILGALIPTLDSDIFAQTIDAIESRLAELGFSLVVATTDDDREVEARKAHELLDIGVEGLVLSGITHSESLLGLIERTMVPSVVISYYDPSYHLPTIGYDNREAARSASQHLLELGHGRIAFVHGPARDNDRTRARLAGAKTGLSGVDLTCFETELSIAGGSQVANTILEKGQAFDAFLCASDILAYGVMFELQRAGVDIPAEVSVMGIHDLPGSSVIAPRLTTVELPAQEMGARAAEALANWVEHQERPGPLGIPTTLIERESTATRKQSGSVS